MPQSGGNGIFSISEWSVAGFLKIHVEVIPPMVKPMENGWRATLHSESFQSLVRILYLPSCCQYADQTGDARDESGNCVSCHQPCYPEPVAFSANPAMQRQPLPRVAQAGFDQRLLDPRLRVPDQSPEHRRQPPRLSASSRSQSDRSLQGGSLNKRRKTYSQSRSSNEAEHASGNVLEDGDAPAPQDVMRQFGEEIAENSTLSAQRSGSSPSFSNLERSTNATSRLTDEEVEPPSSPLPAYVEKVCSCPDWNQVGETHFHCHRRDFCNCCSHYKAWSETAKSVLGPLSEEICQCKDWNFDDPHVKCHGKEQCFCCQKWKAYSGRGRRLLVSHGRA